MNGVHLNGKARGSEKTVPGCLGRMVNLFDLSSGAGNRLLTDKPYNDGSLSRSRSDVSRMSSIGGDDIEDKVTVSDLRRSSSNRKPNETPVKMLIAQEMSKDLELRRNSPNVVAKLMGLDTLPKQQPDIATRRKHSNCYTRKCHSEIPIGYWQDEGSFIDEKVDTKFHSQQLQNEFKDIHEILQQSERTNCQRDKSPQKGRSKSNENLHERRLCLIRQKFMEAKRLATDEKMRQTKEFQDALDVLSSNGDLFLKVLQEPNSMFGQNTPPSSEIKRITVLRPSKMMADDICTAPARRDEKQINLWENYPNGFSPTMSTWNGNDCPTQPTRIVVLKPSSAKVNGPKTAVSSTPSSPRAPSGSEVGAREVREVAKEITQQMRENLAIHRRDETLLSPVLSNGYIGDESSFEKSVNEFGDGNLSDCEDMSPTSRRSWDYVDRFESPYSMSSFSHASCSPESSVCREAKKRLSERWALMSNRSNYEQRQFHRSSSTLGEMLALSDVKKPEICEEDSRASTSCLDKSVVAARESGEDSPRNLFRSKSVPISSTAYGERPNVEVSVPVVRKVDIPEEKMKVKDHKTSFTGKVKSLFFSKSKKSRKEKSNKLQSNDESLSASFERTSNDHSGVVSSPSEMYSGTILVDMDDNRTGQGFHQGAFSVPQPCTPGIQGGNQDQPSPVSVLEHSFDEDEGAKLRCSLSFDPHGNSPTLCGSKFNLIDKSPRIGSISRTISWDERCAETATSYPLDSPFVSPGAESDEGELFYLVQSLLTMAGLNTDEQQAGSNNLLRWHTPESPLDPSLREKYTDLSAIEPLHVAKRRHLRSNRKLVFDSVNAALVDIIRFRTPESSSSTSLADKVWARTKEWFSCKVGEDSDSLVERLVMEEVVGRGWSDQLRFEIEEIGKEVERKVVEEVVEDTVNNGQTSRD